MRRTILPATLAAVALGVFTVPVARAQSEQDTTEVVTTEEIFAYVVNNNWLDMRVYALRSGQRFWLGTVNSYTASRFELPTWLLRGMGEVQLLALAIGSRRSMTTGIVFLAPGEEIVWRLENNLNLSTVMVRYAEGDDG
jgi:hypothetical protein